jgi:hypothetical protein
MKHARLLCLSFTLATGCMTAHVRPEVEFKGSWAEDPAKDAQVRKELDEKSGALLAKSPKSDIEVFVGKLPAGIKLEGGVLKVEDGAPFEILGRASLLVGEGTPFGFPDYEQGWRKGYCYWQAPLTWVTLGIWALIPVNYPCGVSYWRTKQEVLTATKNLVDELGGHVFVGDYINETRDEASGITGFVIRKNDAPEPKKTGGAI